MQIQLVPSAGASLTQFACVPNGSAFNADGIGGTCDVRINSGGGAPSASPEPAHSTQGNVIVHAPAPIP